MHYSYDKSWALGGCSEIFLLPTFLTNSASHDRDSGSPKAIGEKNLFV